MINRRPGGARIQTSSSMLWPNPKQPDPITDEQVQILHELLDGPVSPAELEGFLIVCSRFVDEFGGHRTRELGAVFMTSSAAGKAALRASLVDVRDRVPGWSNCRLRASIPTAAIKQSAFVTFNGDIRDPDSPRLRFVKYFFEPTAQDHESLPGGGLQIGVAGAPRVSGSPSGRPMVRGCREHGVASETLQSPSDCRLDELGLPARMAYHVRREGV